MAMNQDVSDCPLRNLLFIDKLKYINKLGSNPVIINTVRAWRITQHVEARSGLTLMFTFIADNPDFLPGNLDRALKCDLFAGPTVMTLNQVMENMAYQEIILFVIFRSEIFL